jgi:VanZ family protein
MMVLIFIASSISDVPQLPGNVSDKAAHSGVYFALGVVMFRALAGGSLTGMTFWRGGAATLLSMLYGITDEFHQSFVPGRTSDVFDLVADTVGAAAGVVLLLLIRSALNRRTAPLSSSPPSNPSHQ